MDDIAEVLAVADAPGILDRYYHEGKGSDPIVHFYETFLAQYDPAERERRGVYYTPEPVVRTSSVRCTVSSRPSLARRTGLASDGVTLLDPGGGHHDLRRPRRAAGRRRVRGQVRRPAVARTSFGGTSSRTSTPSSLMMAPYAVGHLKMGFFLEELGHRLADDERVPFYLTNTPRQRGTGAEPPARLLRLWPRNPASPARSRSKPPFSSSSAIRRIRAIRAIWESGFGG